MIDVSNRIWSKEDREAWESLIEKMEEQEGWLKPCPFCGHKPILDDDEEETGDVGGIRCVRNYFEIRCRYCGYSKLANHTEAGLNNLVEWWNNRYEQKD